MIMLISHSNLKYVGNYMLQHCCLSVCHGLGCFQASRDWGE